MQLLSMCVIYLMHMIWENGLTAATRSISGESDVDGGKESHQKRKDVLKKDLIYKNRTFCLLFEIFGV